MSKLYESLQLPLGAQGERAGIKRRVYFIPKSEIVEYPKLPDEPAQGASVASAVVYVGDFLLKADSKFQAMDVLEESSPITSDSQGEFPYVTSLNKATLKIAGKSEKETAFIRFAQNDDLLFVYQTKKGKFRVLGNDMYPTVTKPKQEEGGKPSEGAGTTFEIEVTDVCPAPFYVGMLKTEEGDIDCSGAPKAPAQA